MEIPAHVRLLASIQIGSVFYFEEEEISSDQPHYFIVLDKDPKSKDFIILVCASSQVEKRKKVAIALGFPPETLVFISPNNYADFSVETVIDCNRAFEKTSQYLIDKLERGKLRICTELMSDEIVESIRTGVFASNQIPEAIKISLRG